MFIRAMLPDLNKYVCMYVAYTNSVITDHEAILR